MHSSGSTSFQPVTKHHFNQKINTYRGIVPGSHHTFDPFGALLLPVVYSHQVWMRPGLNMKLSDHMEHKKPNVKGRNVTLTRNLFLMVNCCLCVRCSFSYEKVLNRKNTPVKKMTPIFILWKEICHFYKFYRTTYVPLLYKRTIGLTNGYYYQKYKCTFARYFGLEWTHDFLSSFIFYHLENFTTPSLEKTCVAIWQFTVSVWFVRMICAFNIFCRLFSFLQHLWLGKTVNTHQWSRFSKHYLPGFHKTKDRSCSLRTWGSIACYISFCSPLSKLGLQLMQVKYPFGKMHYWYICMFLPTQSVISTFQHYFSKTTSWKKNWQTNYSAPMQLRYSQSAWTRKRQKAYTIESDLRLW